MSDDLREDKKNEENPNRHFPHFKPGFFLSPSRILDFGFVGCGRRGKCFYATPQKARGGGDRREKRERCVISDPVPSLHQFYLGFFVPYNIRGVA